MLKFGTDGVRGVANVDLTPELATALGRVAARALAGSRWAVGCDTRRSSPMLDAALSAGLAAEGVDVTRLGVAPTPMVAWWSATQGAPAAVISASHNPFTDNGIKLFAAGGRKLAGRLEAQLEERLEAQLARRPADPTRLPQAAGDAADVGTVEAAHAARADYAASITSSIGGRTLDGVRLVLDCANGAASWIAPDVLRDLGAEVTVLYGEPDGTNINRGCGSTHPAVLQDIVPAQGATAGIAFDGDADRVLMVDADGRLIDGDQIIAICAIDLSSRDALPDKTVVVTVMTNLGFRHAMAQRGIRVIDTPVGDRHVLETLEEGSYALGGEQSGHVIFRQLATTGDGLLTAVQLLDVVMRSGRSLAALADDAMTRMPQVLRNVRVAERQPHVVDRLAAEIAAVEADLGEQGRVLVRPSGTEPLVRVMVEAASEQQGNAAADRLTAALEALRMEGG